MDHDDMASMCVEIMGGVAKKDSCYCKDDEASVAWDELVADIAKIKKENPEAIIDIPSEIA